MYLNSTIPDLVSDFQQRGITMHQNYLQGKKILYIGDEYVNFLYISELLADTDIEIFRAYAEEQIKFWLDSIPELSIVLISSDFLESNSYYFISYVRKLNPSIAVIVILENQDAELMQKCLECGCDLYVSSYIDSSDLIESMNDVLKSNPISPNKAFKSSET